jgi:Tfp pilus assembly protein PilO
MTLRPRERRLALLAAVLIGCWVLVTWLLQPLWERLRDLRLHVDTHTGKLDALQRLLTQGPSIEREYAALSGYLQAGDEAHAQGSLLSELEALSRRSGVQLNLKPRPGRGDDRVSRFEVELDVEGSQQGLMAFLDELLRLPRLVTIDRLRIATVVAKPDVLRASLILSQLSLQP